MVNNWYECRVKFDKTQENGTIKKVKEIYYVEGINVTEAESRITNELTPFIVGEFEVTSVRKKKNTEVISSDCEGIWFNAKIAIVSIDEKSGSEKVSYTTIITLANNIKDAINIVDSSMNNGMLDWRLYSITETQIIDIYKQD
ncbi:MAG: DUF4494 domain-containing protein [Prevotellaceae bacterium]|nr:DUF4494 domain-containing protein [Candidatus Faecinaster equi]